MSPPARDRAEVPVETLSETVCHLGEGPNWDAAGGRLFWFDILGRALLELSFDGGRETRHSLPLMASAIGLTGDGRQVLVTETGLQERDPATGALTMLLPLEADNGATRSNDARVHPSGAFWVGTMGKKAERHAGAIYWCREGEARLLFPQITIPNSICFAPGGEVAYFADTMKGIVFSVDCDARTGLPKSEPTVFLDRRGRPGGVDGSVVDADGTLWNACWGAGSLDAYAPDGRHLRSIAMPARQVSCPAFVGPQLDRIAVTSAWEGMDEAARAADPQAGKTFLVELDVRGRAEPFYRA